MPRQCRGWLDMIVIMFNVMPIRVYLLASTSVCMQFVSELVIGIGVLIATHLTRRIIVF